MRRVAGFVAFLMLAAACSDGEPTTTPAPTSSETESPTPASSPTPSPSPTTSPATAAPTTQPPPPPTTAPPASISTIGIRLVTFASGFDDPVFMTHTGGADLYVVEQAGRIIRVASGGAKSTYLDIRGRVGSGGERGLLGLAFHPNFSSNGRLFVNYTNTDGDTRISEFSGSATSADAGTERILMTIDQPFSNHNGGMIAFRDGKLWIGTGDGGSGGDPQNNGQSIDTLLGKLLRIDVDAGSPYASPSDNPFVGRSGRDEIWAYGLRNPWRFSFDRATRDLWLADVGQNRFEEVNLRGAHIGGGDNYGWRILEGRSCFNASSCDASGKVRPVAVYSHSQGDCSITGGYVYRGSASPGLRGVYFYGDFCSGFVRGLMAGDARDGDATQRILLRTDRPISSFGEDPSGEVYVVFHDGGISRIASA